VAFTVGDFHDLIRLLEEHPEWRAELRRHVLSDELVELPSLWQGILSCPMPTRLPRPAAFGAC
jgi:hypothetical protein